MVIEAPDALVSDLHSLAGDGLRGVATYDGGDDDLLYVRDDLQARSDEIADRTYQILIEDGLGKEALKNGFEAGELRYSFYAFEELQLYHFVIDQSSGLFVSFDPDGIAEDEAVNVTCYDYLRSR